MQRQVVQVRTSHRLPNCARPWEGGTDVESTCSGFVVDADRRLLMTTAGAVEGARQVVVFRSDSEEEFKAHIVAVCVDADAALLTVGGVRWPAAADPDSPAEPWVGQDAVRVGGYPIGGDTLCVTSGVVSRCEVLEYSHSNRSLLALQVDAPLNNGAWGGPVFDLMGRVLGMALQKSSNQTWMERYDEEGFEALLDGPVALGDEAEDEEEEESPEEGGGPWQGGGGQGGQAEDDEGEGENVGHCVPSLLLTHVLDAYARHRTKPVVPGPGGRPVVLLHSLPVLGMRWQALQAAPLRRHLGLAPGEAGIRVTGIDPAGSAASALRVGDVLTSLGGHPLANDGTMLLRPRQRVLFAFVSSMAHVGDTMPATVVRDGARLGVQLRMTSTPPLVPSALGLGQPLYLIAGGAVLLQLSLPYLLAHDPPRSPGRRLRDWRWGAVGVTAALDWGLGAHPRGEQVIVLSELLGGSPEHEGYAADLGSPAVRRLVSVNGRPVADMFQLAGLVVGCSPAGGAGSPGAQLGQVLPVPHLSLEFADGSVLLLDAQRLRQDTAATLRTQGIKQAMAAQLREAVPGAGHWPHDEDTVRTRPGMQKRQQRRRLVVRR